MLFTKHNTINGSLAKGTAKKRKAAKTRARNTYNKASNDLINAGF